MGIARSVRLTGPERDTELVIVRSTGATVQDPSFRAFVTMKDGRRFQLKR